MRQRGYMQIKYAVIAGLLVPFLCLATRSATYSYQAARSATVSTPAVAPQSNTTYYRSANQAEYEYLFPPGNFICVPTINHLILMVPDNYPKHETIDHLTYAPRDDDLPGH